MTDMTKMGVNKNIRNLLWGLLLYYISSNILILYIPRTICALIDLLGIIIVIYSYIRVPKRKIDADFDIKIIYSFFLIWGLGVAFRGLMSYGSILNLKECVTNPEAFLAYLLPFLFFMKLDPCLFLYLKKIGFVCLILGLVFFVLNINDLFLHAQEFYAELVAADVDDKFLLLGRCGIQSALTYPLLLFYIGRKFRKKELYFFLGCFVLGIISIAYAGRRGGLVTVFLYLLSPFFVKLKIKNLLLLLLAFSLVYFYGLDYLENTFSVLSNRMTDDTRTWAENEFYKGMDNVDWLIGKGSTGTFYSPYFGMKRNLIETGYLHLALKGGIFYSIAWCYILIVSFIKGFYAKSKMVKIMAIYIFPFIPGLYLWGHPGWDFSCFILWICIICCNSPRFRNGNVDYLKVQ